MGVETSILKMDRFICFGNPLVQWDRHTTGCCVAVLGTTILVTAVLRIATPTPRTIATTISVFE
jgi:hypothetical protein